MDGNSAERCVSTDDISVSIAIKVCCANRMSALPVACELNLAASPELPSAEILVPPEPGCAVASMVRSENVEVAV